MYIIDSDSIIDSNSITIDSNSITIDSNSLTIDSNSITIDSNSLTIDSHSIIIDSNSIIDSTSFSSALPSSTSSFPYLIACPSCLLVKSSSSTAFLFAILTTFSGNLTSSATWPDLGDVYSEAGEGTFQCRYNYPTYRFRLYTTVNTTLPYSQ
jgi:hypothetical protein